MIRKEKERRFFLLLSILLIVVVVIGIATFAFAIVHIWKSNTFNNNIFEMIYMVFHLIIVFFAFAMAYKAINNGSFIMSELMYNRNNHNLKSNSASALALIFNIVSVLLFIYSLLAIIIPHLRIFNFPLALYVDVLNVSLAVFIVSMFFYIYPIYMKEIKEGEK